MFPSLGYFKTVHCPENCSRPNCFFRHEKQKAPKENTKLIEDIKKRIHQLKNDITKQTNKTNPAEYVPSKSTSALLQGVLGSSVVNGNKSLVYDGSKTTIQNDMEYDPVVNFNAKEYLSSSKTNCDLKRPNCDQEDSNPMHSKKIKTLVEEELFGDSDDVDDEDGLTIDIDEGRNSASSTEHRESQKELNNETTQTSSDDQFRDKEENLNESIEKTPHETINVKKNLKNHKTTIKDHEQNNKEVKSEKIYKDRNENKLNNQATKSKSKEKKVKLLKLKESPEDKKTSDTSKKSSKLKGDKKKKKEVDVKKYISQSEIEKLDKELSGENIYSECLMLFNEYESKANNKNLKKHKKELSDPAKVSTDNESSTENDASTSTSSSVVKKRVAHPGANTAAISAQRPTLRKIRRSTPAQKMLARFEEIQLKNLEDEINETLPTSKRLAHTPNKSLPVNITKDALKKYRHDALSTKIMSSKSSPFSVSMKTAVKTNADIKQLKSRVAHKVNMNDVVTAPRIAIDRHSKVPTNVRQKCVTMFWNEYLRITNNNKEKAHKLTIEEEEKCKQKSNSKIVYMGVCANVLKRLKTLPVIRDQKKVENIIKNLNNKKSSAVTIGIHSFIIDGEIDLYEKLCHYIMTKAQLEENSYPLSGILPGQASISNLKPLPKVSTDSGKICSRCGQEFILSESGCFKHDTQCLYHWGRAYNTKVGHHYEKRYSCCSENIGALGCVVSDVHVHQDNKHDCKGFVKTMMKSPAEGASPGIYALDCEMIYTVTGLELARVSVVDHKCDIVYDTFVKPESRVLDYNTRWSGITEKDLKHCKVTIRDVQAVFLSKFSAETIFIGHSLESDLVALRTIHTCVIDTAVVFPHKLGYPYKRALRTLMSEYLGIVIQTGTSDGHDSHEDAAACMKLMLWRVNEDSKIKGKLT